jgi:cellulose synthase/poly-beta-1,6-N-acetylglucosamine synthase-like glycosyltransferase
MTFETFLFVVTLAYVIQVTIIIIGLFRTSTQTPQGRSTPFVSIIIAARDEEHHIAHCLDSVTQQTYPSAQYEIIIVNDGSTDGTKLKFEGKQTPLHRE